MSRYLVTGAAGFIGSHLVEALLDCGDDVLAVDRFSSYYQRSLKERNIAVARDFDNYELVEVDLATCDLDPLLDVDGIFHLAGMPGVRTSWGVGFEYYVRDNILASQRLFDAAARANVSRIVYASSSSVYGENPGYRVAEGAPTLPVSPYGVTKLTVEHLAAAYAVAWPLELIGLRYFTVYGPRQRPDMAFARLIDATVSGGEFLVYGDGEQTRDVTYVGDAVDATIKAMKLARPYINVIYNIGGGSTLSVNDAIELVWEIVGRKCELIFMPPARGDVRHTSADSGLAQTFLGWHPIRWHPTVDVRPGLAAQVAAVLSKVP